MSIELDDTHIKDTADKIKLRIGGFLFGDLRKKYSIYIGVTNNYKARKSKHWKAWTDKDTLSRLFTDDKPVKMIPLVESQDDSLWKLEKELVRFYEEHETIYITNRTGGGGGGRTKKRPLYLYIILCKRSWLSR